jgi:phenylacetate-CoA ligase
VALPISVALWQNGLGMNSILAQIIWNTGKTLRNPGFKKNYNFLKESEVYDFKEIEEFQFRLARETLCMAFNNSEFYKEKFLKASFIPEKDFNCLHDIVKIPVTTKTELIQHAGKVHNPEYRGKVFFSETSGSTGQSLKFRKDENWDSFNRASRAIGFSWYGVKPWERNGYLWGYNFSRSEKIKTTLLDTVQNRFRIFSYDEKEILSFAEKLRSAKYLCGYSSMIYEIAKRINRNLKIQKPLNIKMVCGTSEKIYESYQDEAVQAFGRRIIGEYGAAEAGIIAFECPHGSLHINMTGVLVEEEDGEIIVTNLVARSFPIIRYKLGDYIKLKDRSFECPCGRKQRVIEEVLGRVGKVIYGFINTYPSLTFYYVFKNLALQKGIELNYQAVQKMKGIVVLKIQQHVAEDDLGCLKKELYKYFKDDLEFEIIDGALLHQMKGKFKDFITTIE